MDALKNKLKKNQIHILIILLCGAFYVFIENKYNSKNATQYQRAPAQIRTEKNSPPKVLSKDLKNITPPILSKNKVSLLSTEFTEDKSCYKLLKEKNLNKAFWDKFSIDHRDIVGEWFYKKISSHTSTSESAINHLKGEIRGERSNVGKFLSALALSNLLNGYKASKETIDLNEALNLLESIAESDPLNSAPWLYLSHIAEELNNHELAEHYKRKSINGYYFDTYFHDFQNAVIDQIQSPEDLMTAALALTQVPTPNYNVVFKIAKEIKAPYIGYLLIKNNFSHIAKNTLSWLGIEYQTGYNLLKEFGGERHFPKYSEYLKIKDKNNPLSPDKISQLFNTSNCNDQKLWELVDQVKNLN